MNSDLTDDYRLVAMDIRLLPNDLILFTPAKCDLS
jgi:hypothetical protein